MSFKSDIEIAQETTPLKITEVAKNCGVDEKYIEQYGNYKAKIDYRMLKDLKDQPDGKLILVTAITPTPAGEGKTTTSVVMLRWCPWRTSTCTSPATSTPLVLPTT